MDTSMNKIDLEYLTNPIYSSVKETTNISIKNNDVDFYKIRIYKITKDLIMGNFINNQVNAAFNNFTNICIDYFKFIDMRDIIQEDYEGIITQTKNIKNDINLENFNKLMFKKNHQTDISLILNIKPKAKPIHMPYSKRY